MSFEDQPLERIPPDPEPPPPPAANPSMLRWILVGLAGVAAGALLAFWWMSRSQPVAPAPPTIAARDNETSASSRPVRQALDLPALQESDSLLRSLVQALSQHPTLARLLATDGLVRSATLAVVQIGDGRTPVASLKAVRPSSRLGLIGPGAGRIDPATYDRWNSVASALVSISPADAAQLYVNIKPLVDQAYIEMGQGGGDFDRAIVRAIQVLGETPATPVDAQLLRRQGYFEYEDPALRALRPVQKQFLLLGPENQRQIMTWLRQFAAALDLQA